MQKFNESLTTFLVDCRENALEELKSNKQYNEWKLKQADLLTELEARFTPETREFFEEYKETLSDMMSLEYNKILLCGLTVQTNILRRFDVLSPEYQPFEVEFIGASSI